MEPKFGILSVLPPLVTICTALIAKNVFVALLVGLLLGNYILFGPNPIVALNSMLHSIVDTFAGHGDTIVVLSLFFLGGLTYLMERSGGITAFADYFIKKGGLVKSRKSANIFTWLLGVIIFTSGSLSCIMVGAVSRPLNEAMKVSHEKSAFLVHTTSTPVCVLIPLSGWMAAMIGYLTSGGVPEADALGILVRSIGLNFYCLIAVFAALIFSLTGFDFGPMKRAEKRAEETGLLDEPKKDSTGKKEAAAASSIKELPEASSMANLLVPILSMIAIVLAVILITGSGSSAILWGTTLAVVIAVVMYVLQKIFTVEGAIDVFFKGASGMSSMMCILVLPSRWEEW
jgi:Na+/H+ antiporter NhaC